MKYIVKMFVEDKDKLITAEYDAPSVFDAINMAAKDVENPESTILVEAVPVLSE